VVLVVDVSRQAQSAAAVAGGFARHRRRVTGKGVILNRVSGDRHRRLVTEAMDAAGIAVIGAVPRDTALALPSRHLGLVQADEHANLDTFIANAAATVAAHVDLDALMDLAAPVSPAPPVSALPPPGQRIAAAADEAFAFVYPHLLQGWRAQGADILPFSPLANEAPDPSADAVYLPGGYPELHAGQLSASTRFLDGLRAAARRGALVYGECGGFMVLGDALVDAEGRTHAMAGLLPVETTFAERRLQLGYRTLVHDGALPWPATLRGHEFHQSTLLAQGDAGPLFAAHDAAGVSLPPMGLRRGRVMGSYAHVIDKEG
jgi:cobyrinic acid a,c-diamide synthase